MALLSCTLDVLLQVLTLLTDHRCCCSSVCLVALLDSWPVLACVLWTFPATIHHE
jgi:hypothetical protein